MHRNGDLTSKTASKRLKAFFSLDRQHDKHQETSSILKSIFHEV